MATPEQIGRYLIEATIGQGNMGCVYRAFDPNLKRYVAIKMLHSVSRSSPAEATEFKDRFFQEAQVNSRLSHPNIVGIYDSGLAENEPYLVMEYIEGRGLDALLRDTVIPALDMRLNLLEQIAMGLEYAHRKGVVHRDIKPANMLVTNELEIKIVDFGLAKLQDSNLTHTGVFLGTPSYSSPEQITGSKVDRHSDLFSFGLVAHEILFGRRPFSGQNINSILFNLVNSAPDLKMEGLPPQADADQVKAVFEKILAKDSAQRFHGALEFVHALERAYGVAHPIPVPSASNSGNRSLTSTVREQRIVEPVMSQDETMLLSEPAGEVVKKESWKRPFLALGIAGMVGVTGLALFFALRPSSKSDLPPPNSEAALGVSQTSPGPGASVQAGAESPAFPEAGATGGLSEENREELRRKFFEFLDAGNLVEAESTLTGIEVLGVKVDAERRALDMAKAVESDKRKNRSEQARKSATQERFKQAKASGDLAGMERLIKEYQRSWPSDTLALNSLNSDLNLIKEAREKEILKKRDAFQRALAGWNTIGAERLYRELEQWNATTPEEKKAFETLRDRTWTNAYGMRFAKTQPGTYTMGRESKSIFSGSMRAHPVEIPRPLLFGMTEVTQSQWRAVMGSPFPRVEVEGPDLPVSTVTYAEAKEFVNRLNELEKTSNYRLPTEHEWEYACRAGATKEFQSGDRLSLDVATYKDAGRDFPSPVAIGHPNNWGLFDLHGNLWEWVYAGPENYPKGVERAPSGTATELGKRDGGLRGGSFQSSSEECACSNRGNKKQVPVATGFRVVREL